jgi:hypothetical protein
MKAITFISPEQRGQTSGSISYTRLTCLPAGRQVSMAQVWLARLRAGAGAATAGEETPSPWPSPGGRGDAAATAAFERMPRASFEYQPK